MPITLKADGIKIIDRILSQIAKEHYLSDEEVSYTIKEDKKNATEIVVHNRIRDLIIHQPPSFFPSNCHTLSFSDDDESTSTCVMKLKAEGLELFFFSGVLKALLAILNREKHQRVHANRQEIEDTIDNVLANNTVGIICPREIGYKKGIYSATVYVGNNNCLYQNTNHLLMCQQIESGLKNDIRLKMNEQELLTSEK